MVLFVLELLDLLALGWLFHHQREEDRRRTYRKEEVRRVLGRLADSLGGVHLKPWFRKPRVFGHHEGREVELIWLGAGKVEVRCRARPERALSVRRWLGLLGRPARVTTPGESDELRAWALQLTERFWVQRLDVAGGALVARAVVGLDVLRLRALAVSMVELAWSEPAASADAPPVRVASRADAAPSATAEPALRCPYCHDELGPAAPVVHCAACDAPHHPTCFEEGEGCSIAGCQERKARGRRARA